MDITIGLMALLLMSGGQPAPAVVTPEVAILAEQAAIEAAEAKERPAYSIKLTAYNAVPAQTDGNPLVTASGAYSNPDVVVARSHDLAAELPFGTVIAFERPEAQGTKCGYDAVEHLIGYRVVADTTHSRKRMQIDVLFDMEDTVPNHGREINPAKMLGICDEVTVRVVGQIAVSDIPDTQGELIARIEGVKLVMAR